MSSGEKEEEECRYKISWIAFSVIRMGRFTEPYTKNYCASGSGQKIITKLCSITTGQEQMVKTVWRPIAQSLYVSSPFQSHTGSQGGKN
ncbi:hypothetical protein TUM4442_32200 [Shewanella algae]|nr:hypothetical protein TUM4442_32200 [Shewanella algae]BCV55054.1 hypothetical protein TUM17383_33010 [Shewanella algae]